MKPPLSDKLLHRRPPFLFNSVLSLYTCSAQRADHYSKLRSLGFCGGLVEDDRVFPSSSHKSCPAFEVLCLGCWWRGREQRRHTYLWREEFRASFNSFTPKTRTHALLIGGVMLGWFMPFDGRAQTPSGTFPPNVGAGWSEMRLLYRHHIPNQNYRGHRESRRPPLFLVFVLVLKSSSTCSGMAADPETLQPTTSKATKVKNLTRLSMRRDKSKEYYCSSFCFLPIVNIGFCRLKTGNEGNKSGGYLFQKSLSLGDFLPNLFSWVWSAAFNIASAASAPTGWGWVLGWAAISLGLALRCSAVIVPSALSLCVSSWCI